MCFTAVDDGTVRAAPRAAYDTAGISAKTRDGVLEEFSFAIGAKGGRAAAEKSGAGNALRVSQAQVDAQVLAHATAQGWNAQGERGSWRKRWMAGERWESCRSFAERLRGRADGGGAADDDAWLASLESGSERRVWGKGGALWRGVSWNTAVNADEARRGARGEARGFWVLGKRFGRPVGASQSSEAGLSIETGATWSEGDDEFFGPTVIVESVNGGKMARAGG